MSGRLGVGGWWDLSGDRADIVTIETIREALFKKIVSLKLEGDTLMFEFDDGTGMKLYDEGQCCEHRYMVIDDNLSDHVGAKIFDIDLRGAPDIEGDGDVHECQFLIVDTSKGSITVATHNEHNGYYSGFNIRAVPMEKVNESTNSS